MQKTPDLTEKLTPQVGEELARQTSRRLRRGQAPPAEIYQVQNRRCIDWSAFPDWARPCDPDMFEGCSHEG